MIFPQQIHYSLFTYVYIGCYTGGNEMHFAYKFHKHIKIHCEKQDDEEEESQREHCFDYLSF